MRKKRELKKRRSSVGKSGLSFSASDDGSALRIVASLDGKEAGFVEMSIDQKGAAAKVELVVVAPEFRGKGLCRPMVAFALKALLRRRPNVRHVNLMIGGTQPLVASTCYQRAAQDAHLSVWGSGSHLEPTPQRQFRWAPPKQKDPDETESDEEDGYNRIPLLRSKQQLSPRNARALLRLKK